jgi:hypothetical protein
MRCSVTGNKRRGLADFLGKELKSVPVTSAPPKSVTSRVQPVVTARPRKEPPAPEPAVEVTVEVAPSLERAVTLEVTEPVRLDAPAVASGVTESVRPEVPTLTSGVTESVSSRVPEGDDPSLPRYLRLTRKEVRFREDQLDALDRVVRRLVRARRGGGERITENTLVRVAVDLLLERADALSGATEAELLRSLRGK